MPLTPVIETAKVEKLTDLPKFGTVVFNEDPEMLGRIKVHIPGIFDGTPDSLPWIRRKQDTAFCGNDCEIFDVPNVGSVVEIKWSYDNNTPTYSGAPYSKKHGCKVFTNNYPYEGGIRFGKMFIKFDKGSNLMTISNGLTFITCDALGNITLSASGAIELNSTRDLILNAPKTCVKGNLDVEGAFNCKTGASGSISMLSLASVAGGMVTGIK